MVPGNWLVLSGAHDLLSVETSRVAHSIAEIIIHEHFNLDTFDNDIALLKLTSPIQWGPGVSPVCLPSPDYEFQGGYQCIITGWGVASKSRCRPIITG